MIFGSLRKQTEKAIIDYSRQVCVLKESDFVNKLQLIVGLFRTVTSHCHVHEQCLEVGLCDLV